MEIEGAGSTNIDFSNVYLTSDNIGSVLFGNEGHFKNYNHMDQLTGNSSKKGYLDQEDHPKNLMFSTQKLSQLSQEALGNLPSSPNSNRLVDIKLRPLEDSKDISDGSWRYSLSRIYNQILQGKDDGFFGKLLSKGFENTSDVTGVKNTLKKAFDVNENIVLTLDNFPQIRTNNSWETASTQIESFIKSSTTKYDDQQNQGKSNENKQNTWKKIENYTDNISLLTTAIGFLDGLADNSGSQYAAPGRVLQPWSLNVPVWKDSGNKTGVDFKLEFKFNMGQYGLWNAYEEVYKPAINLIAPVMMRNNGHLFADGPGPNVFTLLANAFGNLLDNQADIGTFDEVGFFNKIEEVVLHQYTGYVYEVSLGNFAHLTNVMFKNGGITWGTEVDNYGYPTSAIVSLDLKTMTPMALNNSSSLALAVRFGGMNS